MPYTPVTQTPSTFVSSSTPTRYDVFLSFRGIDTRLTFTGHLYDKLVCSGIKTFKDDPELRSGEKISDALLDAIRKSKCYIVVISQNYASSRWCLDELVEILNCHKADGRLVIPVFFNIDPAVVRHQTGSFEQAFKKHQDRLVETEKVNKWRFTLTKVCRFSGYHISENRSEADVINEIVHDLLLKINPKDLDVTKYPVGLDSRVKAITTLLSTDTEGVIKFGIYGMGGVGKTTLAKALFNQLLRGGRFKGSCFLANVRENSGTPKGLVSLQQQLIHDVSAIKVEIPNVDQGIQYIRERICSAKILVLIDDIYDLEQYESLAGPFASGSVVIITTRDVEMLDKVSVEPKYRYRLEVLDDAQSRELFIKYAFEKAEPPPEKLLALSDVILGLAGGLPLALQVFGSHLLTKKEVGWKSYIKTLQQHPNSTIEKKLAISLDALEWDDRMLRKMFIDIACFFIGWKKEKAVEVLATYYSYPDDKMETLTKRCLLTMNNSDTLEMHDLLRDVGRNVARNDAPDDEPEKYSRLWLPEDIGNVLKNHKGTVAIEGIIPYGLYHVALNGKSFNTETFKWMSKLRFLYLVEVNLTGSFQQMFEDLRVLYWDWCPLKCLPSDFYPKKLVILELRHSKMTTMWDLNMVSHVFGKLKTLNMSGSEDLSTTPDFTNFPCLETLDLSECTSLETVHVSIGSLGKLVSLNLYGCKKLRSLPDGICNLTALKVLTISYCISLKAMPTHLGKIISLTELIASGLTVSKLPDSIGNLTKLVELNLRHNKKIETLPDSICNLRSLEILDISCCEKLETLPDELWKITRLRELNAIYATMLKKLPDIGSSQSALSLQKLILSKSGITALPSGFSQLSNLETLYLGGCDDLLSIPELPSNLKQIIGCESLERIPNLSNLKHLETLNLRHCRGLTEIQGLEELASIEWLGLGGLAAHNLTKRLFQAYSEFGRRIKVDVPEFMNWITESPYWKTTSESESRTMYAHLLPNEWHNLMAIILCFTSQKPGHSRCDYSVKNTTSGFIWSDSIDMFSMNVSVMVIVPKSIFSVRDDEYRIEITARTGYLSAAVAPLSM